MYELQGICADIVMFPKEIHEVPVIDILHKHTCDTITSGFQKVQECDFQQKFLVIYINFDITPFRSALEIIGAFIFNLLFQIFYMLPRIFHAIKFQNGFKNRFFSAEHPD